MFVSWKLAANEQLNRIPAVLRNVIDQRFNANRSKLKSLLLQTSNYKILGIVFAKTDLSEESKKDSKKRYSMNFRSSCLGVFSKKGVLKNFEKFRGKHLCWSLFLKNLQVWGLQLYLKEAPAQVFSSEICHVFKKLFRRTSANRCFWNFYVET